MEHSIPMRFFPKTDRSFRRTDIYRAQLRHGWISHYIRSGGFIAAWQDDADGGRVPFRIDAEFSGSNAAGVMWGFRPGDYWRGLRPTNALADDNDALASPDNCVEIIETPRVHVLDVRDANRLRYKIKVSLNVLFDVRYNPFEQASYENEEGNWDDFKNWVNYGYIPVMILLYDDKGAAKYYYYNNNIRWSHSYVGSGSWQPLSGSVGSMEHISWLSFYDQSDRKSNTGFGGWQGNKRALGWYSGGLSSQKSLDGELLPAPPISGYIKFMVYSGVWYHDNDADRPYRAALWDKVRWLLYKDPKIEVVKSNGNSVNEEDVKVSAWINKQAKESLDISTIIGTAKILLPSGRGYILRTSDSGFAEEGAGSVIQTFYRAGETASLEQLLAGTVYSNYARRMSTLSGTIALEPSAEVLSDASSGDAKYMLLSEVQSLGRETSEIKMAEIAPDSFTGIEYDKSKFYSAVEYIPATSRRSRNTEGAASGRVVVTTSGGDDAGLNFHTHSNYELLEKLREQEGYLTLREENPDYAKPEEPEGAVAMEGSEDSESASDPNVEPYIYKKIKAGDADKWDGHAFGDYMNQPLRTGDDVRFKTAIGSFRTPEFVGGMTGLGGRIDEHGDAEMQSLKLRGFLEVPELRYNRVEISMGDTWYAPSAGIIESVDTTAQTITLKLEEGEIGSPRVGDICMGIFHNLNTSENATADYDDGRGNRRFAGFATCYFRITEELDTATYKTFKYQLRPVSGAYPTQYHPAASMTFVGYGSFSNEDRQTSRYETRTYQRYLTGVSDWEFTASNIAAQYGDLSNLSIFGIKMRGYSAYLNNIYMSGVIQQFTPGGEEVPTIIDRGVWSATETYNRNDDVYWNNGHWRCLVDGTKTEPGKDAEEWVYLGGYGMLETVSIFKNRRANRRNLRSLKYRPKVGLRRRSRCRINVLHGCVPAPLSTGRSNHGLPLSAYRANRETGHPMYLKIAIRSQQSRHPPTPFRPDGMTRPLVSVYGGCPRLR